MEASKACDFVGCLEGNDVEIADAVQAYVQAYLQGPETWVQIPRERGHRNGSIKGTKNQLYVLFEHSMAIRIQEPFGNSIVISIVETKVLSKLRIGTLVITTLIKNDSL